jgi:hypothetical protein
MSLLRVAVTGGRNYDDWRTIYRVLDEIARPRGVVCLLVGDAEGADIRAEQWAIKRRIHHRVFRALWSEQGKSAGPKRNQRLLDEGLPELLVAFPGGRGTADMVRRAKARGLEVIEVPA